MISAKRPPADILEHAVGNQGGDVRLARSQIHVEETVVVEIGEIASHRGEDQVQTGRFGHILEVLAAAIVKEPVGITSVRLTDQSLHDIAERAVVAGGEDVEPAVVVVIPGPAREALARTVDLHGPWWRW